MRHMAAVPKGFLRYQVLRLLSEKPMSGSEIMSEIERRTDGRWKPSPGSIYPLLAWLQDKGYIEEAPEQEARIKRYALTNQGRAFLKEYAKKRKKLPERLEFLPPPFLGFPDLDFHPKKVRELIEAEQNLMMAVQNLLDSLREKYSEEIVGEATEVIEKAVERLSGIANKLRESDE
jgi:DNA-binding PadR family transcriptional regulator